MTLRVVAVSAPEHPVAALGDHVLKSGDPASLFNACRHAAWTADSGRGRWSESNWAVPRSVRRSNLLLMHSWEGDQEAFLSLLRREAPTLLLIGAMTPCLPGAIACATAAKGLLGDDVCIVLGGRHVTETMYQTEGTVSHHPGSPLRLMQEGVIPPVFDFVVAGEGEQIITSLGERVAEPDGPLLSAANAASRLEGIELTPGRWILGWLDGDRVRTRIGSGADIDHDAMPAPCRMFGITTSFDVFGGRPTAHVFSDSGSGCAFDCAFCSERRSVAGPLMQLPTSPQRLFQQLRSATDVVRQDHPGRAASAFVEDSTLLGGSPPLLARLVSLLEREPLDIRFGGQFTIDQILAREDLLRRLKSVGFDYVFVGLETIDPQAIGGMSKDVRKGHESWVGRTERMLDMLADIGIACGTAVLFGLGETQRSRLELFDRLRSWRAAYGAPAPISLNWAVQHPLKGNDEGAGYRYHEWGIPAGPFLDAFRDFGEASLLYPIPGSRPPSLADLAEIRAAYSDVLLTGAPGGAQA